MEIKKFLKKYPLIKDILFAIALSLLILLFAMLMLRFFTNHGKEYLVPDFTGYSLEQLEDFEKNKNEHNFKLTINDSVFMPDLKGGIVISQDPQVGMKIKKGRKIYLSITMMVPPQVEMPNLLDLSLRQAMNMLEANNLELGQVIYKPSKYPNAVLEQRYKGKIIQERRKIPYQAKITLVVGKEVGADTPLEDVEISD